MRFGPPRHSTAYPAGTRASISSRGARPPSAPDSTSFYPPHRAPPSSELRGDCAELSSPPVHHEDGSAAHSAVGEVGERGVSSGEVVGDGGDANGDASGCLEEGPSVAPRVGGHAAELSFFEEM